MHKRAYKRNRIRRRVRSVLKEHIAQIAPGFDIAIIAKPDALTASFDELTRSVVSALRRAKLHE